MTKIREHLLKAIEEDRYEILKSPAYLKGFLKTYAKYLGLNPDDIVRGYQKYLESMILSKEPESKHLPTVSRKRLVLWLFVIFIFITVLFIGIFLNHTYQFLPFPGEEGIIAHTSASDSTFSAYSERGVKYGQSRCKRIRNILWERDQTG